MFFKITIKHNNYTNAIKYSKKTGYLKKNTDVRRFYIANAGIQHI